MDKQISKEITMYRTYSSEEANNKVTDLKFKIEQREKMANFILENAQNDVNNLLAERDSFQEELNVFLNS